MVGLECMPWYKLKKPANKYGTNVGQSTLSGGRGHPVTLYMTWVCLDTHLVALAARCGVL